MEEMMPKKSCWLLLEKGHCGGLLGSEGGREEKALRQWKLGELSKLQKGR
jgi:hypothetical protein